MNLPCWLRQRLTGGEDRGSIALYLSMFAVAMMAMAGLVLDGGAALAARQKAADVAEQAARAGADALSPDSLRSGDPNGLRADPAAAYQAAKAVVEAAGVQLDTVSVNGATVTVTVTVHKKTAVLSAAHVQDVDQKATQSATSVRGITTGN